MTNNVNKGNSYKIYPLGENVLVIHFGRMISKEIHQKVMALNTYLETNPFVGMIETIPTYSEVTVLYDPFKIYSIRKEVSPYTYICSILEGILADFEVKTSPYERTIDIPVCYGGELGYDLNYVAEYNSLSVEEVISIHSGNEYLVYMLGFTPGFPYLGGMSNRIVTPRRETPCLRIPAGSVGIGGAQTGVYPMETPGGWQIIGKTPITLFNPENNIPSLLQTGDKIRFLPISISEYENWRE